jgi:DNA-binding transcriptional LysR family regulator
MEIRWLEDFLTLARTRHFSRAAEEQNITQPTFSRRIKMLEEEMGVMLINRETLPLSLTPEGQVFLEASEKITRLLKEAKETCHEMVREEANKLRFATNQTLYLSFFKQWIKTLNSGVELGVNLKSTAWPGRQLVQALEKGECDLLLCYWSPDIDFLHVLERPEYDCVVLGTERLIPVTALNRHGVAKFKLPGSDEAPLPYIGYNDQTFLQRVLAERFRGRNPVPHLLNVNENAQAVSVKAMIAEGYGVGWLPARLLNNRGEQGLVPAGGSEWEIEIQIRIYRSHVSQHPMMMAFWNEVIKQSAAV